MSGEPSTSVVSVVTDTSVSVRSVVYNTSAAAITVTYKGGATYQYTLPSGRRTPRLANVMVAVTTAALNRMSVGAVVNDFVKRMGLVATRVSDAEEAASE
jgi:hypothetical protein